MSIKIHDQLHRLRRDMEGSISAEFVAVLIVVGAIIAALWAADISGEVEDCGGKAVEHVFSGDDKDAKDVC